MSSNVKWVKKLAKAQNSCYIGSSTMDTNIKDSNLANEVSVELKQMKRQNNCSATRRKRISQLQQREPLQAMKNTQSTISHLLATMKNSAMLMDCGL